MLTLEQMTPEQKLGRILCCRRFREQDDIDFTLELVKNQACGALSMIFDKARLPGLVKLFRDAADYPVIMVNDMELGYPLSSLPKISLSTLSAANNPEYIRMFAAALAKEAKDAGFSGWWGPNSDISYQNRPCTFSRVAGDSLDAVLPVIREICKVCDSYNFHCTVKHYPNEKGMPLDSHMVAPPTPRRQKKSFLKKALYPI